MGSLLIGGLLSALGGLGGAFAKPQTSDTTSNSSTTPQYDPQNLALRNQLLQLYADRTSGKGATDFQNSYTLGGLNNLRRTAGVNQQAVSDMLTARGIGRTTAGGSALADTSYRTGSGFADFLNNIPMIMDQRQAANLSAAGGYQASLPVGSNTTGTSHTVGLTGGGIGGAIQGVASTAAGYMGAVQAQNSFDKILKGMYPGGTSNPFGGQGLTASGKGVN